ncbi:MAG: hypothetical protein K5896_05495 [Prevotella sp.]|jgi:hypothetical protein|nr:hypothetical protein [Prevotella sp.]
MDYNEGRSRNYRTEVPFGEDQQMEDEQSPLDIQDYIGDIIAIVALFIFIAIVRHFTPKRDKKGCTFFIIIFASVLYLLYKFIG